MENLTTTDDTNLILSQMLLQILSMKKYAPNNRADGLHCSEMGYYCPRREVLKNLFNIQEEKDITPSSQFVFDTGTIFHKIFQDQYWGPLGILIGKWRCQRCGKVIGTDQEMVPMPINACECIREKDATDKPCKDCIWKEDSVLQRHCQLCYKWGNWTYEEIGVFCPELNLTGHADGILLLNGKKILLEMKTIRSDLHEKITSPYYSHIVQVNLYMWLLNLTQAIIVYIDKGGKAAEIIKVFPVDFDENVIKRVQYLINLTKQSLETHTLPRRLKECVSSNTFTFSASTNCPVKALCFNNEEILRRLETWQEKKIPSE